MNVPCCAIIESEHTELRMPKRTEWVETKTCDLHIAMEMFMFCFFWKTIECSRQSFARSSTRFKKDYHQSDNDDNGSSRAARDGPAAAVCACLSLQQQSPESPVCIRAAGRGLFSSDRVAVRCCYSLVEHLHATRGPQVLATVKYSASSCTSPETVMSNTKRCNVDIYGKRGYCFG